VYYVALFGRTGAQYVNFPALEDVWVTPSQKVQTSDLERTIIDCLDRPELCGGISEVAKGIWAKRNEIDYKSSWIIQKNANETKLSKKIYQTTNRIYYH